jgi:hypothetical protein
MESTLLSSGGIVAVGVITITAARDMAHAASRFDA